jgi:hypothetical protein
VPLGGVPPQTLKFGGVDIPSSWLMSLISSFACSVSDCAVAGSIVNDGSNAALLSNVLICETSGLRSASHAAS